MASTPNPSPITDAAWPKALVLLAFLGAGKFALRWEEPAHVRWALAPAVGLVESLLHVPFSWVPGEGYRNLSLRILVDHSCAGSGFFLMSLMVCLWHFPWTSPPRRWLVLAGMIVLSLLGAIAATGLRLAATIHLVATRPWFDLHRAQVHTWIGVGFYFCSLVTVHLLARRVLSPETP